MLQVASQNSFRFDAVQMPLNVMDAHFRSFEKQVLPELVRQGIGVLGMKSMGGGVILKSNAVTGPECLRYALSLPTSVVIAGIDSQKVLDQAIQVASTFQPLTAQQVSALLAKSASAAAKGQFELFKTTNHFDATAQNPQWLGGETRKIRDLAPRG
jgi:aryl-alcohol dehydrogenase-like predicted oxidoreductase